MSKAATKKAQPDQKPESTWAFTKWYRTKSEDGKTHGEVLNDTRRDRYKTDPAYRAQVLEANRKSRRKHREEQLKSRSLERKATKTKLERRWKEVEIDGKKYITIGALASYLGRSRLSVRQLEEKGVIEPTPHRNPQGERLYTPEQVSKIHSVLASKKMLEPRKMTGVPEVVQCKVKLSDGTIDELPLFRIGIMAKVVGRSPITLEQMERRGAIPSTPLRLPPNRRVFTLEQIEAIKDAFDKRGGDLRSDPDKGALKDEILTAWKALNLLGAEVVGVIGAVEDEGA